MCCTYIAAVEQLSPLEVKVQLVGSCTAAMYYMYKEKSRASHFCASTLTPDPCVQDRNWTEYWRLLFKEVTVEDIRAFESSYKGGEEEKEALKQAYLKCEGDMDRILEEVRVVCE